jgi:putative NADH-flavin reductase
MRVAILGASGGVGRWVTKFAAEAGHAITALVRPDRVFQPPPDVRVLRGSALDQRDLTSVLEEQDILISCLGAQRTQQWNPWSPLRPPARVAGPSARAITAVVPHTSVRRVVVISAAGVGDSLARTNAAMRWMLRHSTLSEMYADLGRMEDTLRASSLDWVAVRPVTLVNATPSSRTRVLSRYGALSIVGRADVAAWLVGVATGARPDNRTPMIGWW